MNKLYLSGLLLVCTLSIIHAQKHYNYPNTPKDLTVDNYFEDSIADPYQWMENPDDPRLKIWLKSQSNLINKEERKQRYEDILIGQLQSMFTDVEEFSLHQNSDYLEKFLPKYVFQEKISREDRYPDLYYKRNGDDDFKLLVKIKDLRKSRQEQVVIKNRYVNEEHDLLALELSRNGSDWRDVVFFDLSEGFQIDDTLKLLRASSNLVWHGKNLYYDGFDPPSKGRELLDKAKGQKLYYHSLGSPQSDDKLLFSNSDPSGTNNFTFFEMEDRLFFYHYLKVKGKLVNVRSVGNFNGESIFLRNFLVYPTANSLKFDIQAVFADSALVRTNWNAPNYKVIKVNINQLNKNSDLIPEYDVTLKELNRLGKDKFVCIYRNKNQDMAMIYNLEGSLLKKIDFNEGKKVKNFFENNTKRDKTIFQVSSFYHPDLYYELNLDNLNIEPIDSLSVPYNPNSLETKYVKYRSKDGTEIPMYISCLKGTELDGNNPTILYGYGGYGKVLEPNFKEENALWMIHGGILAVPNVRGGGAEGSDWGEAGKRLNKQNAVDDFIAAAEFLIENKYTSTSRLAVEGASHGGMLVGAAITQRPELFKAAVGDAGAFDLLRFEKYTVGSVRINLSEFGTTTNLNDYENLKAYSPLHNIQTGVNYPDILLFTGDQDDRVPPFHSYKMMAELQSKESITSKYLLYVVPGSGHSGASNPEEWAKKLIFKCYFLFDTLGLNFKPVW